MCSSIDVEGLLFIAIAKKEVASNDRSGMRPGHKRSIHVKKEMHVAGVRDIYNYRAGQKRN
jgi:hypothetical protein